MEVERLRAKEERLFEMFTQRVHEEEMERGGRGRGREMVPSTSQESRFNRGLINSVESFQYFTRRSLDRLSWRPPNPNN